jgi:hypothetical protein
MTMNIVWRERVVTRTAPRTADPERPVDAASREGAGAADDDWALMREAVGVSASACFERATGERRDASPPPRLV